MSAERTYTNARPRGLAPWRPQAKTRLLLDAVNGVLTEYAEHLPLTGRQIFYRLVGTTGYPKTENGYEALLDKLSRARRSGLVPFGAIRDDGVTARLPYEFDGMPDFWSTIGNTARRYRRERLEGQPHAIEVWVEAAGMVPQAVRVAEPFGIPVYSSGGFDSLTAKYDAAKRVVSQDRRTVVLHIGDHDPSGCSVFDAAREDVSQLALDLDQDGERAETRELMRHMFNMATHSLVEFRRVAVTAEQAERYDLPTSPPKPKDKRGDWTEPTVQAEALPPDVLAEELRLAVESLVDRQILDDLLETEAAERRHLRDTVDNLRDQQEL